MDQKSLETVFSIVILTIFDLRSSIVSDYRLSGVVLYVSKTLPFSILMGISILAFSGGVPSTDLTSRCSPKAA